MSNDYSYSGIQFLANLTLILITLKLCGVIAWSWVWVLAPLWIPLALFAVFAVIALIVCAVIDKH